MTIHEAPETHWCIGLEPIAERHRLPENCEDPKGYGLGVSTFPGAHRIKAPAITGRDASRSFFDLCVVGQQATGPPMLARLRRSGSQFYLWECLPNDPTQQFRWTGREHRGGPRDVLAPEQRATASTRSKSGDFRNRGRGHRWTMGARQDVDCSTRTGSGGADLVGAAASAPARSQRKPKQERGPLGDDRQRERTSRRSHRSS